MFRPFVRVLPLALVATACYTYAPIPAGEVTPAMTVRLEVSGSAAPERVEGRVFEVGTGVLSLLPEVRPGMDSGPRTVQLSQIMEASRRRLDATRTVLVIGAGAAAGIGVLLLAEGSPGDTRGPGGPGDFSVLPMLRALLSLGR